MLFLPMGRLVTACNSLGSFPRSSILPHSRVPATEPEAGIRDTMGYITFQSRQKDYTSIIKYIYIYNYIYIHHFPESCTYTIILHHKLPFFQSPLWFNPSAPVLSCVACGDAVSACRWETHHGVTASRASRRHGRRRRAWESKDQPMPCRAATSMGSPVSLPSTRTWVMRPASERLKAVEAGLISTRSFGISWEFGLLCLFWSLSKKNILQIEESFGSNSLINWSFSISKVATREWQAASTRAAAVSASATWTSSNTGDGTMVRRHTRGGSHISNR